MSFWQILGRLAVSDEGETIQRVSDNNSSKPSTAWLVIRVSSDASPQVSLTSACAVAAFFVLLGIHAPW